MLNTCVLRPLLFWHRFALPTVWILSCHESAGDVGHPDRDFAWDEGGTGILVVQYSVDRRDRDLDFCAYRLAVGGSRRNCGLSEDAQSAAENPTMSVRRSEPVRPSHPMESHQNDVFLLPD